MRHRCDGSKAIVAISRPCSSRQRSEYSAPAKATIVAEEGVLCVANLQRMEANGIANLICAWLRQKDCRWPKVLGAYRVIAAVGGCITEEQSQFKPS